MKKKDAFSDSVRYLSKLREFKPLIAAHGTPQLRRGRHAFQSLSRAIIYQQISGKAAGSIYKKFVGLFGITIEGDIDWENPQHQLFPTPELVLAEPDTCLRSAGLSLSKITYLKDLARHFAEGHIDELQLITMDTEALIPYLTRVKGIGVWTVHMFLIFTLNRPDVLPTGDLAIRKGFQMLYKLETLPTHKEMEALAQRWRAHASAASWYLWRLSESANSKKPKKCAPTVVSGAGYTWHKRAQNKPK